MRRFSLGTANYSLSKFFFVYCLGFLCQRSGSELYWYDGVSRSWAPVEFLERARDTISLSQALAFSAGAGNMRIPLPIECLSEHYARGGLLPNGGLSCWGRAKGTCTYAGLSLSLSCPLACFRGGKCHTTSARRCITRGTSPYCLDFFGWIQGVILTMLMGTKKMNDCLELESCWSLAIVGFLYSDCPWACCPGLFLFFVSIDIYEFPVLGGMRWPYRKLHI